MEESLDDAKYNEGLKEASKSETLASNHWTQQQQTT
jgi:hypothetical protein